MCGSVKLSFWNSKLKMNALGVLNQLFHKLAADVRQPKVAALETVGQFGVIEAEQVQQGGVQVMNVNLVPRRVETKLVGFDEFGFNAARDKVHVHDLHATLLHLLGFDHTKLTYRFQGRDFRL